MGGGGAGDAAAFALRKQGFDGLVTIISSDRDRPYDRPYLSKEFLRGDVELPKVFLHDEADYAKQGIELQLNRKVTGGSIPGGKLAVDGGGEVEFDMLILGLGGTPRRLHDVPRAENVFTAPVAARQQGDPPGARAHLPTAGDRRGVHRRGSCRVGEADGQGRPDDRGGRCAPRLAL